MPTEVDYSKRGIWENIFDPGAWQNVLGGVKTITTGVAGIYEQMEKIEGSQGLKLEDVPKYDPNLSLRDFAFTPNVKLMMFGGALLLVALVIRKK